MFFKQNSFVISRLLLSFHVVYRCFILAALMLFTLPLLAAPQKTLEKVSLQLKWVHAFQFAGYYAAKEKGFYAAEGLDVDIKPRIAHINNIDQVLNGESEYGVADSNLLIDRLNGKPVIILASIFQHNPLVYISLKSSGIVSPYEFKGKRISDENSAIRSANAPLLAMRYEAGIDNHDVTFVDYDFNLDDLINGKTDLIAAYATNEVYYYRQKKVEINIIDPRNYGIDFLGDNLFTTEQEIKQHPDRVQRFLRASLKGWNYALKHSDEIIALILEKYSSGQQLSKPHLRFQADETLKMILPDAVPLGSTSIKRFQRIAETYQQLGLVNSIERLEGFIYQPSERRPLNLTSEEKNWLKSHPIIRVGIDKDYAPYEWTDAQDHYLGLSADYIHLIEQQLGIKFKIIKDKSWAEVLAMAKRGEVDILSAANQTPERQQFLNFTLPYIEAPAIIVSTAKNGFIGHLSRLNGKTVVVEKSYFMQELLKNNHPQIQLLDVKNSIDALEMVKNGQADAYIGDAISTNYALKQKGLTDLMFSGDTGYKSRHRMAAVKNHPLLINILTKALDSIPNSEKQTIQNRWMTLPVEVGIKIEQLIPYIIAACILFGLIIFWNMRLKKEITQRKKVELALRRSEERWRTIFQQSRDASLLIIDGIIVDCNNATLAMFAANREQIIGKNPGELSSTIQSDGCLSVAAAQEQISKIIQDGSAKFEWQHKKINGDTFWAEVVATRLDINGKIGLFGVIRDISERKRLEDELRKSHDELLHYFEQPFIGMLTAGHDKKTIHVNQRFCDIVGYSKEEMQLLDWGKITYPDDLAPNQAYLEQAIRGEIDAYQMEKRYFHKDGHLVYVDLAVKCVRHNNGTPNYFIGMMLDITERKQLEDELRKSHDELLHYFEQPLIGMMTSDINKKTLNVNQRFCDMLGYSKEEMLSLNWAKLTHPDDVAHNESCFRQAVHNGLDCYELEKRYLHKDGHIVHAHLAVNLVRDAQKQLNYVIGMALDITERKQIDIEYQTIIEASLSCFWCIDFNGKFLAVNTALCKMLGYSKSELLNMSIMDIEALENREKSTAHIKAIIKNGHDVFETQHKCKDGTIVDVAVNMLYVKTLGERFFAFGNNITERKKIETELRIAAKVFEAQEGIIITGSDGLILKVNQGFSKITGYSSEEAIGKNPRFLSSGQHTMNFYAYLWKSVYQFGMWQGEIWNKRKNGEIYPQWITITAVTDQDEQYITHYVAIFTDITERKQIEKAMQEAEAKAVRANQAKSEFLANMSHEIRTPMNAIIGMLHLAQRTELTIKQRNYLNKIDYATQSLLSLVNDILDFSKIEAGKLELEKNSFLLQEILDYVADIVDIKAKQKNIVIDFLIAPQTPQQLVGDSLRLSQILVNLVTNAVKFTPKGNIVISVSPDCLDSKEALLRFSVQDSGIGMTTEQITGLFLPFTQADNSITRKYGGSGLGLVICKQLVELMKGQIWVESQPNKGSTFYFTVKLGISTQEPLNVHRNPVAISNNFNGRKILLVEDNEINRELAIELLTELGIRVEIAENGKQGVERIKNEAFDLVLMDIQMPEMDGLTATRLIRADEKFQNLPIIAMTAHAMSGDKEKSLTAGMNDHLTKPIDLQKLLEVLSFWLIEKQTQPHPSTPVITPILASPANTNLIPENLPGFDIPAALARVRGNSQLLQKLLLMFHRDYAGGIEKLQKLIETNNYQEAVRFVHTLKGVAANLEAKELAYAATEVEQQLKKDPAYLQASLNSLAPPLQSAIMAIAAFNPTINANMHVDTDFK